MSSGRVWTNWWGGCAALALTTVVPAWGAAIDVIRFDTAVQTAQGGQYRCVGALPNHLQGRLLTAGKPARGAWELLVMADAPASGFGGIVPLFDTTVRGREAALLDISQAPQLEICALGALGDQRLHVELVPGRSLDVDAAGVRLGMVDADKLSKDGWTTLRWSVPADAVDRTNVGSVRFLFEGTGAARVALAGVRFVDAEQVEPMTLAPPEKRPALRQALWVWRTTRYLPEAGQIDALLAFCRTQGITDLFWQIPYNKFAGGKLELLFEAEQRAFNARAHAAGLRVHALDGAPEFVLQENHDKVFQVVAAVDAFNQAGSPAERYDAAHMDNEPYVLAGWKRDAGERQRIIQDYYALNQTLHKQVHEAGMVYGVDIPFWWDKPGEDGGYAYTVRTEAGMVPLLEALFPLIDNAGIMSYRVQALGGNGVVDCCRSEFELGGRLGVEVFASVELGTGKKVEPGISFGVYPADYFLGQRETLLRVLPHQRGCAGLAIHAYYSFADMLEN